MNDSPDLLSGISGEARKEAEQLKAEAQKNNASKLASVQVLKTRLIEESRVKGEKQAAQIRKSGDSSLAVELRRRAFKREERLNSQILKDVRRQFSNLSESPRYTEVLTGWIVEGAIGLGADHIIIHASAGTLAVLTALVLKKAEQAVADLIGKDVSISCVKDELMNEVDLLLKDQTGRLVYDNRVEARLQRYDHHIRGIIAGELLQDRN
ncbi:V-type ATP synthase subunit E [Oceanispirochaeta sp.]|jgi:vacuolar-type H+-ATPase subunit E/Vma4|uniref:V-type ATP synthase subunit E n=1 Tax=Oceanispirochaeta sp. TaxID=2035350 RepID=UPI002634D6FD|nr:V-type ATP synthase subunit E family protein [Oceanispirochaeta sp.]MDA3958962.1 V-type ATP synthase subunit E family protein [Oceanispirochaeta sp.]